MAAKRDTNRIPVLIGVSASDGVTPVMVYVDATTHRLYVDAAWSFLPTTSGGLSVYRDLDCDESGANIKAAAGQVYGWFMTNAASTTRYIKFYNKATAPTVGTDTPVMTLALPPYSAANVHFDLGIAFATGIGIGATTGAADNDTGAPSTNDVIVNILYY